MAKDKVIFIVGPTAVGKSSVAYALFDEIKEAEVVSCDSAQVYREVTIASNKPSAELMRRIPHHLVDIISVTEKFDVHQFSQRAEDAIADIVSRGHVPIVVGGSGLYMKILLDGMFEGEGANWDIRTSLMEEFQTHGNEHLHQRLKQLDEQAAKRIHPNDIKKIIRALEVCLLDGEPISQKQTHDGGIWDVYDVRLFGISQERAVLYDKINRRVDQMVDQGLVEEVRALVAASMSLSAAGLIGIKEILPYTDGRESLERAVELMKRNTRRFAKRQMTWFRKESRIQWLEREGGEPDTSLAQRILKEIS